MQTLDHEPPCLHRPTGGECTDARLIQLQMEAILGSPGFLQSQRMVRFLRYIVDGALKGTPGDLKETSIGTAVYDRQAGYDTKLDPVVRNEARRLRRKLEQYYETDGRDARILIALPRGGYLPTFSFRAHPCPQETESAGGLQPSSETSVDNMHDGAALPQSVHEMSKPLLWSSHFVWLLGAALLLVILGGIWWRSIESKQTVSRVIPLTSVLSQALQPAISPDGRNIAFVWDGNGKNFDIYVTQKGGTPLRITTDAAYDMRPSWSPDGASIAYLRSTRAATEVMAVDVPGGEERRLFSLQSGLVRNLTGDQTQSLLIPGPTWTPDGKSIIVSDQEPGRLGLSLFQHSLDSNQTERLTDSPGESRDYNPKVSPNGTYIAFIRNFTNLASDVFLLPLHGGAIRRLTNERADVLGLAWLGDDRHLLISSNRSGPYALWSVDIATGAMTALPASGEGAIDPATNRRGSLIAYSDVSFNANIRQVPLTAGVSPPGTPLWTSSHRNNSAQYSPDGSRIAFASDRSGTWEIWVAGKDSAEAKKLTNFNGPMVGTPRWSPDGTAIAFDARPSGASNLFIVSPDGGNPRPVSTSNFEDRQPSWSHDGKSLFFYSNRSGHGALWRISTDGSDPRLIADEPAVDPQESSDGRDVYFTSRTHLGLMTVSNNGGKAELVSGLETLAPNRLWQLTSNGIYYVDSEGPSSILKRYDIRGHRTTKVVNLPGPAVDNTPSLSISPDARFALITLNDELRSNVMLLEVSQK